MASKLISSALAAGLLVVAGSSPIEATQVVRFAPTHEPTKRCFVIGGMYNPRKRVQVCRRFVTPEKIVADGLGNLYVLDLGNGPGIPEHITKLSSSGRPLAMWGTERFVWDPQALTVDSRGDVYVLGADLLELSPTGREVAHWNVGSVRGLWGWEPTDLAVDGRGTVYLTGVDWTHGRRFVARLAPSRTGSSAAWTAQGGRLKLLALWTTYEPGSSMPARTGGYPTIAVDSQRFVYVTEPGGMGPTMPGGAIYKLSPTGRVVAAWRIGGVVSGVAVDRQGDVYVAEGVRIQKFDPHGRHLATIGTGVGIRSVAVDGMGAVFALITSAVDIFSPVGRLIATWT